MKNLEDMTIAELREFAAKVNIVIPEDKTLKKDILDFLKKPKSKDPAAEALAAQKTKEQEVRDLQAKTRADSIKRACKQPLNEKEKVRLAELEKLSRSGKQPDTDQMRELGILRERSKITQLSVVEKNELDELEVKRQAGVSEAIPSSGVTEDERYEQLEKRRKINEE